MTLDLLDIQFRSFRRPEHIGMEGIRYTIFGNDYVSLPNQVDQNF